MDALMLVIGFDLAMVLNGRALAQRLSTDEEVLLRLAGSPVDPLSLAEKDARLNNRLIVPLTSADIGRIVCGGAVAVYCGDRAITVRMSTADELLASHAAACRRVGMEPSMTREKAEELTRTL